MVDQKPLDGIKQQTGEYEADLVICLDGTGSMSECMAGVKEKITSVVQEALLKYAGEFKASSMNLRYRLVVFRDLKVDGGKSLEVFDFTEDPSVFVAQLQGIAAEGGGDEAESALDALLVAFHSDWKPNVHRAVALFTDAPSHAKAETSTLSDLSLDGLEGDVQDVITLQAQHHVKLFVAGPECDVFNSLDKKRQEQVIWEKSKAEGLADVDLAEFFDMIVKTLTRASVTQPVKS